MSESFHPGATAPRYVESRLDSESLLRQAVAQIGRHPAACNPITFAVWYEHLAGINASLSAELNQRLEAGVPIGDAAIQALHRRHVDAPDAQALEQVGTRLRGVLQGVAHSAVDTGGRAQAYGAELGQIQEVLGGHDAEALSQALLRVLDHTTRMRRDIASLEGALQSAQVEIEDLHVTLERTRAEAALDALSGLANRRAFDLALASACARRPPDSDDAVDCLVMLDLDHFKAINDRHGHLAGDRVIAAVGAVLRNVLPRGDHLAARYGGEEFALILRGLRPDDAMRLALDALARVRRWRLHRAGTQSFSVTLSAGLAQRRAGDDAQRWASRADAALYAAKQGGRDRLEVAG
jgi:diguanylate cyclase